MRVTRLRPTKRTQVVALLAAAAIAGLSGATARPAQAQSADAFTIADVEIALDTVPTTAAPLKLSVGKLDLPRGGHLQGIQLRHEGEREIVYLSHDSETVAYLVTCEFPTALAGEGRVTHVHKFPSDGQSPPLRHAGGFQIAGDVLAIGLEDNQLKTRSEVQFWNVRDVAKPAQLAHLTVRRSGAPKEQTAGAVALVAFRGSHLLAVANWDSRAVDVYRASGFRLDEPTCRFEHLARWRVDAADVTDWQPNTRFGSYQAINLLVDSASRLWLMGFDTEAAGPDVVDLFAVDVDKPAAQMLRKVARQPIKLATNNHFRFAGGAGILNGRPVILASSHSLADVVELSVSR